MTRVCWQTSRRFFVVLVGGFFVVQVASASITYQLIDGAAGNQDGHHLSGFIEFDQPCGKACTAANVTDFSFSVTGTYGFGHSYSSPDDVVVVNGMGHLNVTPTSIALQSFLEGQLAIGSSTGGFVQWTGGANHFYRAVDPDKNWPWFHNSRSSVIAKAVPEPSAFVLLLLLVCGTSGFVRGRRR